MARAAEEMKIIKRRRSERKQWQHVMAAAESCSAHRSSAHARTQLRAHNQHQAGGKSIERKYQWRM